MGVEGGAVAAGFMHLPDQRIVGLADVVDEASRFGARQGNMQGQMRQDRSAFASVMQIRRPESRIICAPKFSAKI